MLKSTLLKLIFTFTVFVLFTSCEMNNSSADLVLINGNVLTLDSAITGATAIAVKGDKILFVGSDTEALKLKSSNSKIIDLNKKTVIPGLIESHAHLLGLGLLKIKLDLLDSKSWDEIVNKVKIEAENAKPGEWIVGRGWHQEKWNKVPKPNIKGYPFHTKLSRVSPNNPVMLSHASGHAIFVNQKAMELAGINKNTKVPEGGEIIKDSKGNPIGVFTEDAELLITKAYNEYQNNRDSVLVREEKIKAIKSAEDECLQYGITSFHDAGEKFEDIDLLKELASKNKLNLRLNVMVGESNENLKRRIKDYKLIGFANNFLRVNSIKVYCDGALGSRGAWMLKEYSDMPGHFGLNVTPIASLKETAQIAKENGFQLCTHAIGDRGNREILNIYEEVAGKNNNLRWRVEHAQHLNPAEVSRFSNLNIIAAMQGIHCTSDAPFVEKRLGSQRAKEGAYIWHKLLDAGVTISNGTDAPVERVNPFENFYASVTRKLKDGSEFYPEQKMTRLEALKSYTINGAYASFEENLKGTLSPGKLADITVLSNNLLTVDEKEILNTKVIYTIVGGEIKYSLEKE